MTNSQIILVVDDDLNTRDELKKFIEEKRDLTVVGLESGNHAVKYIQMQNWSWLPAMVITDLVMDGMGGYQLMRRINELFPNKNIPIIVISKLGSPEDIAEAETAGAIAYIRKPIKYDKLLSAIDKAQNKDKDKGVQLVY